MNRFNDRTRGILWDIHAAICFTLLTTLVKFAGRELSSSSIAFFRTCSAMIFVVPFALSKGIVLPKRRLWKWYGLRTVAATAAVNAVFYAYKHLHYSTATVVGYTEPMMQMVVAIVFFGASIRAKHWVLMFVGYLGVFLIAYMKYDPSNEIATRALLLTLLASLFISGVKAITKYLTCEEAPHQVIFYSGILNSCSSLAFLFFSSSFPTEVPSWSVLMILPLIGLMGFLTQYSFTKALSLTDIHVLAPIPYLRLIFALPIGYYLYGEVPTWPILVGGMVIIIANYFILRSWEE